MSKLERPRMGKVDKKTAGHPQYFFRLPKSQQERLDALIEEVIELLNAKKEPGESEETKSSVLARAAFRGLEILKKEHKKG